MGQQAEPAILEDAARSETRMARPDLGIPEGPEALTPELMTECLLRAGALASGHVREVRTERFAEGVGLLGQLVRVHLDYAGAPGDAPSSLVVKFPSASAQNVALCEALGLYAREHHFYTRSAGNTPLRVPRAYYSALDGLTRFILVLEDVKGTASSQVEGAPEDRIFAAVREIARHHAAFWQKGKMGDQEWIPALNAPAVSPVVQHITSGSAPRLLAELPESFNATTRAVTERLVPLVPALADAICSGVTTFVHGDFRIDNLIFSDEPGDVRPVIVDWQICYDACPPYDVAYLMTQSVTPELRRRIQQRVLEGYHQELLSLGITGYSFAQCYEDYRRATTYCLCYPLIAAGTLDLSNERGRALGQMMLARALSACEDVDSLGLLKAL